MMTITEQNKVYEALPKDIRKKYDIKPFSDFSQYKRIDKDGYAYYPEINGIVVDDSILVNWDTGEGLQKVDIKNPEHLTELLERGRRRINAKLYIIIKPSKDPSRIASVNVWHKDPVKERMDTGEFISYKTIPYDGSVICYLPGTYESESEQAVLKYIATTVRYMPITVFAWLGRNSDEWEDDCI